MVHLVHPNVWTRLLVPVKVPVGITWGGLADLHPYQAHCDQTSLNHRHLPWDGDHSYCRFMRDWVMVFQSRTPGEIMLIEDGM